MRRSRLSWCVLLLGAACHEAPAPAALATGAQAAAPLELPTAILYPKPKPPPARLGVLSTRVYVHARPTGTSPEIGALSLGNVVELGADKPQVAPDCDQGWVAIKPEGYVCADSRVTRSPDTHPLLSALHRHAGRFDRDSPYGYASSRLAPWYRRVPTTAEQRKSEGAHLDALERAKTGRTPRALRGADLSPSRSPVPEILASGAVSPFARHFEEPESALGGFVPARSSVAFVAEFSAAGRSFLLTHELYAIPKDRVAVQRPSTFHGVRLERGTRLPLAFVRAADSPVLELEEPAVRPASGSEVARTKLRATGGNWERLSWVGLTGRVMNVGTRRYLQTRHDGQFIEDDYRAAVVRSEAPKGFELGTNEKWIDISIHRGTLVAYEGRRAVFATLISPGIAGYKRTEAGTPAKHASPTGTFRMEWKHRSTTMSPDPERKSYYLSEVPWTQFFHMPFALHAAYWHDRFGEPKSGGCVNLSPADAKWLFDFTLPQVPDEWHGVRSGGKRGPGTLVRVR